MELNTETQRHEGLCIDRIERRGAEFMSFSLMKRAHGACFARGRVRRAFPMGQSLWPHANALASSALSLVTIITSFPLCVSAFISQLYRTNLCVFVSLCSIKNVPSRKEL